MKKTSAEVETSPTAAAFPETRWSRVLAAREGPAADAHLNTLLGAYWKPVYAMLRRVHGLSPEDAEDTTQEFLATLLQRDFLAGMTREGARFRTFLKAALTNHLRDRHRSGTALKRGGGRRTVAMDLRAMEDVLGQDPSPAAEDAFEREWRRCVLEQATKRMSEALGMDGRESAGRVFEMVDLRGEGAVSYREAAGHLGLTEAQVRDQLHYARRAFRASVLDVLRDSVTSAGELDAEVQELFGG